MTEKTSKIEQLPNEFPAHNSYDDGRVTFIYLVPTDTLYIAPNNAYHRDIWDWLSQHRPDQYNKLWSDKFKDAFKEGSVALGLIERDYEDHTLNARMYWAEGNDDLPQHILDELGNYFGEKMYARPWEYPRDWTKDDYHEDDYGGESTQQWPTDALQPFTSALLPPDPWNDPEWLRQEDENHSIYGDDVTPGFMQYSFYAMPDGRSYVGGPGQSHMHEEYLAWGAEEMGFSRSQAWTEARKYQGAVNISDNEYEMYWPKGTPPNPELEQKILNEILEDATQYRKRLYEARVSRRIKHNRMAESLPTGLVEARNLNLRLVEVPIGGAYRGWDGRIDSHADDDMTIYNVIDQDPEYNEEHDEYPIVGSIAYYFGNAREFVLEPAGEGRGWGGRWIEYGEKHVYVEELFVDPAYRSSEAFRMLVQPIIATGLPIDADFENERLQQMFMKLVERGKVKQSPAFKPNPSIRENPLMSDAKMSGYEQQRDAAYYADSLIGWRREAVDDELENLLSLLGPDEMDSFWQDDAKAWREDDKSGFMRNNAIPYCLIDGQLYLGPEGGNHTDIYSTLKHDYGMSLRKQKTGLWGWIKLDTGEIFAHTDNAGFGQNWHNEDAIRDAIPDAIRVAKTSGTQPIELMLSPEWRDKYQAELHRQPGRLAFAFQDGTLYIGVFHRDIARQMRMEGLNPRQNTIYGWIDPENDGQEWSMVSDYGRKYDAQDMSLKTKLEAFFLQYPAKTVMNYARTGVLADPIWAWSKTANDVVLPPTTEYEPTMFAFVYDPEKDIVLGQWGGIHRKLAPLYQRNFGSPSTNTVYGWMKENRVHKHGLGDVPPELVDRVNALAAQKRSAWKISQLIEVTGLSGNFLDMGVSFLYWAGDLYYTSGHHPDIITFLKRRSQDWYEYRDELKRATADGSAVFGWVSANPKSMSWGENSIPISNNLVVRFTSGNLHMINAQASDETKKQAVQMIEANADMFAQILHDSAINPYKIAHDIKDPAWVYDPETDRLYTGDFHRQIIKDNDLKVRTPNELTLGPLGYDGFVSSLVLGLYDPAYTKERVPILYSDYGTSEATREQENRGLQLAMQHYLGSKTAAVEPPYRFLILKDGTEINDAMLPPEERDSVFFHRELAKALGYTMKDVIDGGTYDGGGNKRLWSVDSPGVIDIYKRLDKTAGIEYVDTRADTYHGNGIPFLYNTLNDTMYVGTTESYHSDLLRKAKQDAGDYYDSATIIGGRLDLYTNALDEMQVWPMVYNESMVKPDVMERLKSYIDQVDIRHMYGPEDPELEAGPKPLNWGFDPSTAAIKYIETDTSLHGGSNADDTYTCIYVPDEDTLYVNETPGSSHRNLLKYVKRDLHDEWGTDWLDKSRHFGFGWIYWDGTYVLAADAPIPEHLIDEAAKRLQTREAWPPKTAADGIPIQGWIYDPIDDRFVTGNDYHGGLRRYFDRERYQDLVYGWYDHPIGRNKAQGDPVHIHSDNFEGTEDVKAGERALELAREWLAKYQAGGISRDFYDSKGYVRPESKTATTIVEDSEMPVDIEYSRILWIYDQSQDKLIIGTDWHRKLIHRNLLNEMQDEEPEDRDYGSLMAGSWIADIPESRVILYPYEHNERMPAWLDKIIQQWYDKKLHDYLQTQSKTAAGQIAFVYDPQTGQFHTGNWHRIICRDAGLDIADVVCGVVTPKRATTYPNHGLGLSEQDYRRIEREATALTHNSKTAVDNTPSPEDALKWGAQWIYDPQTDKLVVEQTPHRYIYDQHFAEPGRRRNEFVYGWYGRPAGHWMDWTMENLKDAERTPVAIVSDYMPQNADPTAMERAWQRAHEFIGETAPPLSHNGKTANAPHSIYVQTPDGQYHYADAHTTHRMLMRRIVGDVPNLLSHFIDVGQLDENGEPISMKQEFEWGGDRFTDADELDMLMHDNEREPMATWLLNHTTQGHVANTLTIQRTAMGQRGDLPPIKIVRQPYDFNGEVNPTELWEAKLDGKTIAQLHVEYVDNSYGDMEDPYAGPFISNVYVDDEYKRMGVATALLRQAEQDLGTRIQHDLNHISDEGRGWYDSKPNAPDLDSLTTSLGQNTTHKTMDLSQETLHLGSASVRPDHADYSLTRKNMCGTAGNALHHAWLDGASQHEYADIIESVSAYEWPTDLIPSSNHGTPTYRDDYPHQGRLSRVPPAYTREPIFANEDSQDFSSITVQQIDVEPNENGHDAWAYVPETNTLYYAPDSHHRQMFQAIDGGYNVLTDDSLIGDAQSFSQEEGEEWSGVEIEEWNNLPIPDHVRDLVESLYQSNHESNREASSSNHGTPDDVDTSDTSRIGKLSSNVLKIGDVSASWFDADDDDWHAIIFFPESKEFYLCFNGHHRDLIRHYGFKEQNRLPTEPWSAYEVDHNGFVDYDGGNNLGRPQPVPYYDEEEVVQSLFNACRDDYISKTSSADRVTVIMPTNDIGIAHTAVIYDPVNDHLYVSPGGFHRKILRTVPRLALRADDLGFYEETSGSKGFVPLGYNALVEQKYISRAKELYDQWADEHYAKTSAASPSSMLPVSPPPPGWHIEIVQSEVPGWMDRPFIADGQTNIIWLSSGMGTHRTLFKELKNLQGSFERGTLTPGEFTIYAEWSRDGGTTNRWGVNWYDIEDDVPPEIHAWAMQTRDLLNEANPDVDVWRDKNSANQAAIKNVVEVPGPAEYDGTGYQDEPFILDVDTGTLYLSVGPSFHRVLKKSCPDGKYPRNAIYGELTNDNPMEGHQKERVIYLFRQGATSMNEELYNQAAKLLAAHFGMMVVDDDFERVASTTGWHVQNVDVPDKDRWGDDRWAFVADVNNRIIMINQGAFHRPLLKMFKLRYEHAQDLNLSIRSNDFVGGQWTKEHGTSIYHTDNPYVEEIKQVVTDWINNVNNGTPPDEATKIAAAIKEVRVPVTARHLGGDYPFIYIPSINTIFITKVPGYHRDISRYLRENDIRELFDETAIVGEYIIDPDSGRSLGIDYFQRGVDGKIPDEVHNFVQNKVAEQILKNKKTSAISPLRVSWIGNPTRQSAIWVWHIATNHLIFGNMFETYHATIMRELEPNRPIREMFKDFLVGEIDDVGGNVEVSNRDGTPYENQEVANAVAQAWQQNKLAKTAKYDYWFHSWLYIPEKQGFIIGENKDANHRQLMNQHGIRARDLIDTPYVAGQIWVTRFDDDSMYGQVKVASDYLRYTVPDREEGFRYYEPDPYSRIVQTAVGYAAQWFAKKYPGVPLEDEMGNKIFEKSAMNFEFVPELEAPSRWGGLPFIVTPEGYLVVSDDPEQHHRQLAKSVGLRSSDIATAGVIYPDESYTILWGNSDLIDLDEQLDDLPDSVWDEGYNLDFADPFKDVDDSLMPFDELASVG